MKASKRYNDCVYFDAEYKGDSTDNSFRYSTSTFVDHYCMPEKDFAQSAKVVAAFRDALFEHFLGDQWAHHAYNIYKAWYVILIGIVMTVIFSYVYLVLIKHLQGCMLYLSFMTTCILLMVIGFYTYFHVAKTYEKEDPTRGYVEIFGIVCFCAIILLFMTLCCYFKSLMLGVAVFKTTIEYVT